MKKKIIEIIYRIKGKEISAFAENCCETHHNSVADMKRCYSDEFDKHFVFVRWTKKDYELNGMDW